MATSEPSQIRPHLDCDKALEIAEQAHRGQVDRHGAPYLMHPLRVSHHFSDDTPKIVALLHEVLECSSVTREDLLSEGVDEEVMDALDALARRDGERQEDHLARVNKNDVAFMVKRADLLDQLRTIDHITKREEAQRLRDTASLNMLEAMRPNEA